jgi:glycosyltransferase involved in cell wall biosynthesis
MRIAQVAPLAEAVPPSQYGGTERVVSWLTEELVRQGHQVTLFASGDSVTSANLVAAVPESLRLKGIRDHLASTLVMLDQVRKRAAEFDIIHFHVDLLQFPMFQRVFGKCITTLHGRLDIPDFHPVYRAFPKMPLVSISNHQRLPMPKGLNWAGTIYHGLPPTLCPYNPIGGDYLLFLGRIAPEKRPDRAIEIARRVGIPLKIAAKVDPVDENYFSETIKPMLKGPFVEFIGEVGDAAKAELLGNAMALLFPIDWPEPFGLVMIEAMSAGTPVICWRAGSVPEIVENGVSGLIVGSIESAVEAVKRVQKLDRRSVRHAFEQRFTAERMASNYVSTYHAVTSISRPRARSIGEPVQPTFREGHSSEARFESTRRSNEQTEWPIISG